jgi:phosphatidylserine decarboxylase
MGWFQHGSTIIVFAPKGFNLCENIRPGALVRAGHALLALPEVPEAPEPPEASETQGRAMS